MNYDFKCLSCFHVSSEHEWNKRTYQECHNYSPGTSYIDDKNFFPINKEYEEGEGAWFYCPNCDGYHDGAADIIRVIRQYRTNKDAKTLLERSW